MKLGLQASFWVATQELPNAKFKFLLSLLRFLEIPDALHLHKPGNVKNDIFQYICIYFFIITYIFNQMLKELSKVIEGELASQLRLSRCDGEVLAFKRVMLCIETEKSCG